jgi:hypothetical protein
MKFFRNCYLDRHIHLCLDKGIKSSLSNKSAFETAVYQINEELMEILYQINMEIT